MKKHLLLSISLLILSLASLNAADTDRSCKIRKLSKAIERFNADEGAADLKKITDLVDSQDLANIALKFAAPFFINMELIEMLIEKGADPHFYFRKHHCQGKSLLGVAITETPSCTEFIPRLMALGVHPDFPNRDGKTPLHVTVAYLDGRAKKEMRILIQHGANPLLKNNQGETPREAISNWCWDHLPEESQEVAQFLEQEEQRCLQRVRTIRNQGIPRRPKRKVRIRKATQPTKSASNVLSKPWPSWKKEKSQD